MPTFLDGLGGACDEIWALGLRNPWRFSFDSQTGDMFIGDVGQNQWEEVNFQPATGGGENWGWRCYEGNEPFNTSGCGDATSYEFPFFAYDHSSEGGIAVTGGYVYRGNDYPDLNGYYLFADYGSGNFWTAVADGGGGFDVTPLNTLPGITSPSSFGESCDNELFVADYADGQIYQIQTQVVQRVVQGALIIYFPVVAGDGGPFVPGLCID